MDVFRLFTLFVLIIGVPLALLFGAIFWLQSAQCHNQGDIQQRESRFSAMSGCFLHSDSGKFLPADAYRDLVN